jgi:hypothetical protein
MQFRWLWAVALLAPAACGPAPAPPLGVTDTPLGTMTMQSIDAAEDAVVARLRDLGFVITESRENGLVTGEIANGAPAAWSFCDRVLVRERDDGTRTDWAEADDRRTRVAVRFSELGGQTSVSLTPRFTGLYLDRFDNLPFDRACSSTGQLEPQILAALGDG